MKLARTFSTIAISGVMALAYGGIALADDSASVTDTGPGSSNSATVNNNDTFTSVVTNNVIVTNSNSQTATTGSANVSGNTNGGSAVSGDATNNNQTSTVVTVNNPAVGGVGNGGDNGGGAGNGNGGSGNGGSGNGSVLGASTGGSGFGAGTLPEVGASVPVDVSALRSLYNPNAVQQAKSLVNTSRGISAPFLILAALLSLIGAFGSAVYAQRRENQA